VRTPLDNSGTAPLRLKSWRRVALACAILSLCVCAVGSRAQAQTAAPKKVWSSVEFAIVKFNDSAPNSWNIYHTDKKGVLLVRLWKRYLLIDVAEEEVYDIDPKTVSIMGDKVEWSYSDMPEKPIDTPEFKERNVGSMDRIRFRLGKDGHYLELQMPLGLNGRPIY
jgi:hypothetical protein